MRVFGQVFRHLRDKVHLAVKIFPDAKTVDRCLQVMRTDRIEIVMPGIQSMAELKKPGLVEEFEKRKKEGKVRFLGMACHSSIPRVVGAALELDCFDAIMVSYNLANRKQMAPLIAEAKERDVGLIGMKSWRGIDAAGGGQPSVELQAKTMQELLGEPQIATILHRMGNREEVEAFAALMRVKLGRGGPEVDALGRQAAACVCASCGKCEPCPAGVRIQDVMRYAQYAIDSSNAAHVSYGPEAYARLRPRGSVDACTSCGRCEGLCPSSLPVRKQLATAHVMLTESDASG